ncbi:MAG: ankyrin repeat domain-containing protein [Nitrospirota bacterium]|nr:MAG: ankyrin repeat domain-containing protein [Nitrospirota bacterium]
MSFRQIIFVIIICLVAPSISLSASKSVHKIIKYAYHNDTAKVMELVNSGIPVDTRDHYGKTTLMWAVVNENVKMARFLISKRADVNASDSEGTTVLMWAVVTGNPLIVKILLENGADTEKKDIYGKTALMTSMSRKNRKISELLKKNGTGR